MILFTGLTGKSGRWLLRSLENDLSDIQNQGLRALVRKESSLEILNRSSLNIEKVIGDASDEKVLRLAMDGVDVVFHIAGIHTSRSVAKVALEKKVKWLILVHTTGIYSKYKSAGEEYRNTEKIIADLAKDSNTQITILRPTMIYGSVSDNNMVVFIKMVDRLRLFPVVSGGNFELQPVYEKSQIFTLISHWEGFPRTIIEAMRAGLPVIASDVGGAAEAIHEGISGFTIPRGDVDTLRNRLQQLINNPQLRHEMGAAARQRYEQEFTFDRMFAETCETYKNILLQSKSKSK